MAAADGLDLAGAHELRHGERGDRRPARGGGIRVGHGAVGGSKVDADDEALIHGRAYATSISAGASTAWPGGG
ncbi:MAG: hypothetical protein ABJC51_05415, partial [Acidobacteriota bacterium]